MTSLAPPEIFKHRADFLRLARQGRKRACPGFVMQYLRTETTAPLRTGYTATKKIGNAVARNRARRRLKEAARLTFPLMNLSGVELVLICRQETSTMPFAALCAGLRGAVAKVAK